MGDSKQRELALPVAACRAPEIGTRISTLTECRERTNKLIAGMRSDEIDWIPPCEMNSIGTLLYHIAAIELDWLYSDILEQDFPHDFRVWFPHDVRDSQGNLSVVEGDSIERHQNRLRYVRAHLLDAVGPMSLAEFRRVRRLETYDVTPEWVLHHLAQHEAQHRGQMAVLRRWFESRDSEPTLSPPTDGSSSG